MLRLSEETGKPVLTREGHELGRLKDLSIRLGATHPAVHRLLIRGSGKQNYLVPWSAVASFELNEVRLSSSAMSDSFTGDLVLEADELLLRRDVLDTQIFDANRHRMTRVSEVLLNSAEDGRLDIAAVEVGMGAVVRRLGMGRLGSHLKEEAVDWRALHLTSDRGHEIQLATSTAAVHQLDARGLAELLTELNVERAHEVIRRVGPGRAAEAVALTHPDVRAQLLPAMAGQAERVSAVQVVRTRRFLRHAGWRRNRPSPQRGEADIDLDY